MKNKTYRNILMIVLVMLMLVPTEVMGAQQGTKAGWKKTGNQWFYCNQKGQVETGWKTLQGKSYYLKKNGATGVKGKMLTDWQMIGSKNYYFDRSGALQTGWIKLTGNWYYLKKNGNTGVKGQVLTGWQTIGGKTYYLNTTGGKGQKGSMRSGWQTIDKKIYHFDSSGAVQMNGWTKMNGKWFYFKKSGAKGAMLTGWQTIDGKRYYMKKNGSYGTKGCMLTGNQSIDGKDYYFDGSGAYVDNSSLANRVANSKTAKKTNQIITVADRKLTLWEKQNNSWKTVLTTPCQIGKNGITMNKQEGDKKTPSGAYTISQAFGLGVNPGSKIPYRKITNKSYWISNSQDKDYNTWQERTSSSWKDEHLMDYQVYKYGLVIDYNKQRTPEKGSAIFIHCNSKSGSTPGCVAVPESTMLALMKRVNKGAYIIITTAEANISNY